MNKNQLNAKGFTLIELIVVIVILGIMSAIAVPKFVNFQSDARTSVMNGLEGAIRGASTLAYSKSLIEGEETQASASVDMSGQTVDTVFGYPAGTAAGIEVAIDLEGDITVAHAAGVSTFQYGTIGATCQVSYTQAAAAGSAPTIVTTTTGC